jgi:PhzF family phenazine biosynthesis protein
VSSQRFTQVDAFTDRPFAGNPAAVCLLPSPRDSTWMQQVAQEMNLAETAFLVRRADGFDLRWFTPALEVDLCGHATLAQRSRALGRWAPAGSGPCAIPYQEGRTYGVASQQNDLARLPLDPLPTS